jgi:hypothetical protein
VVDQNATGVEFVYNITDGRVKNGEHCHVAWRIRGKQMDMV